ncbi:Glutamate--tRNA ligase 2 [Candidatus Competibacter denitrificans Run_A_D11]|uniref:Glutamate--tRNA ligase n=1 Tax=Candidatus Competibacter denitrificans Run_A_D11 TaxID=1400863 RepID=W6MBC1_9GAMM|nr:glutamate--tRNA ligase [Candidatus Competibacter denitrificans]CDI01208.1 Glutamate--tRNA ligase 2 [Candidatus Competibacter denitrificans Run_A_D11]HAS87521.1 glutamate--tRNA ligase [Candidatus Competibacteraceae bacterium]HRC70584.1 glutamate--tRNA ligase [Candidatus Competibacter denitrificans]
MVKTRFAPSPTGYLHIGGARTALFSWLYARRHGGPFVLRIEDTDLERSTPEAVNAILEGMNWLGLDYDEGPFYQTQRFDRYREVLQHLLREGKAYYCYCTRDELDALREEQRRRKEKPRYDGRHRNYQGPPREGVEPVIRFKNPTDGEVVVDDLIRGAIVFQNTELDDLIIARADGSPTYNFCVVVDDMDMGITHVVRGDDHINNTPRQINILKALNAPIPKYGHVPMILGPDGQKLSKRHGAASVMECRDLGYLPAAILNYLVRLGWSHGDQEIFSLDDMVELFDLDACNKAASAINPSKLIWLNKHYLKTLDPAHVARHLSWHIGQLGIDPAEGPPLTEVVKAFAERADTLKDLAEAATFLYREFQDYEAKAASKNLVIAAEGPLMRLREALAALSEWKAEPIHETVKQVALQENLALGKVAQPLRVAVSGSSVSPPIDITLELLGQPKTLERIDRALRYLRQGASGNH